jgi:protein involved in polysaccharide export with SLBB domain
MFRLAKPARGIITSFNMLSSRLFRWCLPILTGAVCLTGFCGGTNVTVSAASLTPPIGPGTHALAYTAPDPRTPETDGQTSLRPLSPNDIILMSVFGEDDLTTKTTIDKNGAVILPLLGQVKIGGLTLNEATELIRRLYDKDYLVNPQVTLTIAQYAERRFSVLGQVQRPGSYDFPPIDSVNLLEAIAMAGGYTRLGSPSRVTVRRIVNDKVKVILVDASKLARGKDKEDKGSFPILPNDVVTVGERTF